MKIRTRINPTLRDAVRSGDLAIATKAIQQESYPPNVSRNEKSKATAILLAIFLGFFTWIYTYEKDDRKFWVAIGLVLFSGVVGAILGTMSFGIFMAFSFGLGLGFFIWVWAVVDTVTKSDEWYKSY